MTATVKSPEKSPERATINIPPKSSVKLGRMVLKMRAEGHACYKQNLLAGMIDYFDTHPELLKEIV